MSFAQKKFTVHNFLIDSLVWIPPPPCREDDTGMVRGTKKTEKWSGVRDRINILVAAVKIYSAHPARRPQDP